jgi:PncC family amidohydrolase
MLQERLPQVNSIGYVICEGALPDIVDVTMTLGASLGPELNRLGELLQRRDLTIAVAESMTGGLLAAALADLPESSKRFLGGVVSYTADKKMEVLGVPPAILNKEGVVSEATARLMAEGARRLFSAGLSISVTGVAGPDSQEGKPVGLTFIGVSLDGRSEVRQYRWPGGRAANRLASVEAAIDFAADMIEGAGRKTK